MTSQKLNLGNYGIGWHIQNEKDEKRSLANNQLAANRWGDAPMTPYKSLYNGPGFIKIRLDIMSVSGLPQSISVPNFSMPKKPKVAQGLPRQRQRPKASDQPVPVYKEALTDI